MSIQKPILLSLAAAVSFGIVAPVALRRPAPSPDAVVVVGAHQARFDVTGMTSAACPAVAEKILARVDGVLSVDATYDDHSVTVVFDPARTDPAALATRIADDSSLRMRLVALATVERSAA